MNIRFENHFSERAMDIVLGSDVNIDTHATLLEVQRKWTENVLMWHTPYSCIVHIHHLSVAPHLVSDWNRMLHMLRGFHLGKVIAVTNTENLSEIARKNLEKLGFDAVLTSSAQARSLLGINANSSSNTATSSLKRKLRTFNHFPECVMELQFSQPTTLNCADDVLEIRSRIEYNMHQWHTHYCVMLDCNNLVIAPEAMPEFEKMQKFFHSFFCRGFVGFGNVSSQMFPFRVFQCREAALENCHMLAETSHNATSSVPKIVFSRQTLHT